MKGIIALLGSVFLMAATSGHAQNEPASRSHIPPGECGHGAFPVIYFIDDMENGQDGWTPSAGIGADTWELTAINSNTPSNAWRAADPDFITDQRRATPGIFLPDDDTAPSLQFYTHRVSRTDSFKLLREDTWEHCQSPLPYRSRIIDQLICAREMCK